MPFLLLLGGLGTGYVLGLKTSEITSMVIIGGIAYIAITRKG